MGEMKRILAVAVGPEKDVPIRAKSDLDGVRPYIEGLIEGLGRLGRQLGTDFVIDYSQCWNEHVESGDAFKAKEKNHDLIYAMSTTVVRAARAHTTEIPIVFSNVSDHGAERFVKKGNATGVSARRSQTAGECFERFLATVPTLKEVCVLHKVGYDPSDRALKLVKASQKKRYKDVKIRTLEVKSHQDIKRQLSALPKRNLKKPAEMGIFVLPVDLFFGTAPMIIDLAQRKNHPTFFTVTDWVKPELPSALGGYGVPQHKCGELTAGHVNQILWEGKIAGNLSVMDAKDDAFEWVVSSAAAKALNIKVPRVI
jgi:ABC-type uncharacterized transport system substrate-binding protein